MYDLPAPMRTMLVVILSLVLTIDIPSTGLPNKSHPSEASALTREFEWKSAACPHLSLTHSAANVSVKSNMTLVSQDVRVHDGWS